MTNTWQYLVSGHTELNNYLEDKQFMPLPQLSILEISGTDARSFLQNLLTNDVDELATGKGQLSGLCNPKGRLVASFVLICRHADCYWIILPAEMCALLKQRLAMYVLRSNVAISNIGDKNACIGLHQTELATVAGLDFPTENYRYTEAKSTLIIKLPASGLRYLIITPQKEADAMLEGLAKHYQPANPSVWQQLDIAAGLPIIHLASSEKFTPQQVNFDLSFAVNFNKGCYPGQEVVARLYYLGKPSRRMFAAIANTDSPPDIASNITTSDGTVAGHTVTAEKIAKHTSALLVSLKISALKSELFIQKDNAAITIDKAAASAMALD